MDDEKSRAIKRYFTPFPTWSIWLAVGVAAGVAWQGTFFAYGLGWAALAVAAWTVLRWAKRPGDAQIDAWLAGYLDLILPRSVEKSHLDAGDLIRDPVMFWSVRLSLPRGVFFGSVRGQDQVLRYTPLHVTVVNFTEHQLGVYQCALDLTTGAQLNESVHQISYKHVVSVATESRAETLPASDVSPEIRARCANFHDAVVDGQVQLKWAESFVLTTSGATTLRVMLRDPVLIEALGGGTLPTDRADQAVRAILAMWRIKTVS